VGEPGRVVVVGLGPGGVDLLVPAARAALDGSSPLVDGTGAVSSGVDRPGRSTPAPRFTRTARHPAVAELAAEGVVLRSFDDEYDAAPALDACYVAIVETLVGAASEHGEVVYAVPGNPAVAERTVELLHDAERDGRVTVRVIPGLSFADAAWARLGIDPLATGARVVDGRALDASTLDSGSPLLIAQCDHRLVLSDVKLVLLDRRPPETAVTVLQHVGLADERITELPLAELDRDIEPDHLTSVFVPGWRRRDLWRRPKEPESGSAVRELGRLLDLAVRLRRPGGCPWDAEQTHHSLTRYLLEESYEVVEAVESLPPLAPDGVAPDDPAYVALVDELGDLLYQVIFHAVLADEAGAFDMADVARGIHDKLVRRHPHVFGDVDADTSDVVTANWEQIKKEEKGVASIVAGITPGLPSLLYAHKLYRKAASVGLDPGDVDMSLTRVDAAVTAMRAGSADEERVLGELLAACVALARALGVDTESALRGWSATFRARFEAMEQLAIDRGLDLHTLDPDAVDALWADAGRV
jgi:tetrapyrrole methylase family protein/MazG family protein